MTAARDLRPYAATLALSWRSRFGGARSAMLDGTLLKVDVSGFTRLSERLARSERTGAEEVNAVIDGLWTELIGEVLDRGGDVLQFGGDALAVWFEDTDHELRAADAAGAMHRVMRARPAQQTPAGKVRLRMSAGADSGEVGMGLVGRTHQELVVLGATATAALRCEVQAQAGQTVVGPRLAAALRRAGGTVDDSGVVRRVPTPPAAAVPLLRWDDPELFLDPQVRELEQVGVPLGEHRRAAVAFMHLGELDAVMADQGVAVAHEQVARVADVLEEQVLKHEVCWLATDLAPGGVVFLLVSGAPRTSEHDEERLLRVVRAVMDAVPDLPLRAGAHSGRGFAGDVGHPGRRTFAVLGDTTNTAARLMGSAAPGQFRVSDTVFNSSDRDHAVEWIGSLSLKGRQQGVTTGLLTSRVTARPTESHELPLLGRDPERDELVALVAAVARAEPGAARLLLGPAGVGKSRLVGEGHRAAQSAGVACLVTQAELYESATPYGASCMPLRELLGLTGDDDDDRVRRLCGEHAELAPLLNLPLGTALAPTPASAAIDPAFVSERRTALLAEVLLRCAQPLVVLAEDLYLADRATLDLLEELARHTSGPVLVVGAGRELPREWPVDPSLWHQHELGPLDDSSARELVLAVAGDLPLDDLQIERVLRSASGNPLFIRELVLWASSQEGTDVPDGVEQVIAARIDRLPVALRAQLRRASVLGAHVDPELLASVLAEPALAEPAAWEQLDPFLEREDDGFRFRQDLYRRVAYQGLPVRHRRAIHLALARALTEQGTSDTGTLSQHLYAAQQWPAAFETARRAAVRARAAGALVEALALTSTALDAGRRAGADAVELGDLDALLGDVADLLGRYSLADEAYRRAARSGSPETRLDRAVKRAAVVERQGRYPLALGLLTKVEKGTTDRAALRAALLRRSSTLFRCGRLADSRKAAQRVVDLAADSQLDRARALLRLEMVASELGDPSRFALGEEALQAFEGLNEPRELGNLRLNLGVTMWQADDWGAAVRHYLVSDAAYQRAGDRVGAAFALNNAAEILVDQGNLEQARVGFEDARRVFRGAGHALGAAATDSALGRVYARSGDTEQAQAVLQAAEAELSRMASSVLAADARIRLVEVALLERRADAVERAIACLEDPEVTGVGAITARRYLGIAMAQAGQREEAQEPLRAALDEARSSRTLYEVGACLDHLDRLGLATGEERTEGAAVWARLGVVWAPDYGLGQSSSRTVTTPGPGTTATPEGAVT